MVLPGTSSHRLGDVPLFAHLDPQVLDQLAASCRIRRYPQGQILCSEGDPGDSLIVLEEGQLRISRYTAAGDEAVLAVIEPPAVVGELALLDGAPRDATITAQRAVVVRHLPRPVFLDMLKRGPVVLERLLQTLAGMVRFGNARHADFVSLDVPGRLAKWLLGHAQTVTVASGRELQVVVLHRSQGELAAELGTTRSTLNRALHDFEVRGLIAVDGESIVLRKLADLQSYSG